MALPNTFANQTSPNMQELDQNDAALGAMGTTHCTATGTNTITLSPLSNQPTVAAYTNQQIFDFAAAASSNGPVTVQVGSLASLPLYLIGGAQAASGDITISTPYLIQYLSTLNTGGGGFQILSAVPSSAAVAQSNGMVHGLLMFNNSGTPNTKIDITAGYSLLTTTGGTPKFLSSVSVTIDLTTTGANGMDTGARPTSGWVYCYIINNGSVTAGLATATSPTAGLPSPFPGGYSNFAYVGAMRCDGSQNLLRTRQQGRAVGYTVVTATNTPALPSMITGAQTFWTAVAVASFIPLTAGEIKLCLGLSVAGSAGTAAAAPNNSYGTSTGTTTNAPPLAAGTNLNANTLDSRMYGQFALESTNVYYGATTVSTSFLNCVGWVDSWSAA